MNHDSVQIELNAFMSDIDAEAKSSGNWGSASGAASLGAAAAVLGPIGLVIGGIGAIAAGALLKKKLNKEKALSKIKDAVSGMDEDVMKKFVAELQKIPKDEISAQAIDNALKKLEEGT